MRPKTLPLPQTSLISMRTEPVNTTPRRSVGAPSSKITAPFPKLRSCAPRQVKRPGSSVGAMSRNKGHSSRETDIKNHLLCGHDNAAVRILQVPAAATMLGSFAAGEIKNAPQRMLRGGKVQGLQGAIL